MAYLMNSMDNITTIVSIVQEEKMDPILLIEQLLHSFEQLLEI